MADQRPDPRPSTATARSRSMWPSPQARPRGAIIVIQEIFGVNAASARRPTTGRPRAISPSRPTCSGARSPGVELNPDVPEEFQRGVGVMMKHDFDLGIRDVEAVIHWIRREQGVAKVGLVGFCMGGKIAYMAAARTDIDASVGYYGVGIDQMLDESHAIAKPLLLHVPTADGFVPPEAQKAMHEGLDDNPHVTLHDYEGLDHGFAAEHRRPPRRGRAQLADQRTEAFFAQHVG